MDCPACSSEQWKLASVIYEEGAGSTSNTIAGIGTSFDNIGVGVGVSKGKYLSDFARKAQPPVKLGTGSKFSHPALLLSIIFLVIAILGNLFVGSGAGSFSHSPFLSIIFKLIPFGLMVFYLSVFLFTPNYTEDDNKRHEKDMAIYSKTKICLRCGEFYVDNKFVR